MKESDPECRKYLKHLARIAQDDVDGLDRASEKYGCSWKKRGGVGAFFNFCRKWDRLEIRMQEPHPTAAPYDILARAADDPDVEGIIDDVRDLRRYLLLVEAELRAMGCSCAEAAHRDNQEASNE